MIFVLVLNLLALASSQQPDPATLQEEIVNTHRLIALHREKLRLL